MGLFLVVNCRSSTADFGTNRSGPDPESRAWTHLTFPGRLRVPVRGRAPNPGGPARVRFSVDKRGPGIWMAQENGSTSIAVAESTAICRCGAYRITKAEPECMQQNVPILENSCTLLHKSKHKVIGLDGINAWNARSVFMPSPGQPKCSCLLICKKTCSMPSQQLDGLGRQEIPFSLTQKTFCINTNPDKRALTNIRGLIQHLATGAEDSVRYALGG
jgi:hypothetical protein